MSMDPSGEFQNSAKLQALIPNLVEGLSKPNSVVGPYTKITDVDITENRINPAKEIQTDHSILSSAWASLLTKLSLDQNLPLQERNPNSIISGQEELTIREAVLTTYFEKPKAQIVHPLISYYQDASQDLMQLADKITEFGVSVEARELPFDRLDDVIFYRVLRGIPPYTPRIFDSDNKHNFVLPIEANKPDNTNFLGVDRSLFIIVGDQGKKQILGNMVLNSISMARLFLAEELALHQEGLIHKLQYKIVKVSREKLPKIELAINTINNQLRVATFKQLKSLLGTNDKLFISAPKIYPRQQDKQFGSVPTYEVTSEDNTLIFSWREEIRLEEIPFIDHRDLVKLSLNEDELLLNLDDDSSNSVFRPLQSTKNKISYSLLESILYSIKFITQAEFEQLDVEGLKKVKHALQAITQADIAPREFFSQLGPLKWGNKDETLQDRRLVVSTEYFDTLQ